MRRLAFLVFFVPLWASAQWGEEQMAEKPSIRDRIFTGGGIGLSFNQDVDFFSISPMIGYRISQRAAAGASLIYRHTTYKYVDPRVSTDDFGFSPFVRFQVYGPLFLHAEYEYLNNEYILFNGERTREAFTSFMAGGGFFQPLGRNAGLFAVALYNFSYRNPTSPSDYYPYTSPWVLRAGITAGF
ncbi:MAG: hypothetical protein JNL17_13180 [Cyclobacteriaceae bacterium]|nr:hypothetical protein [Cyclobacteriaceae bacterium]